MSWSSITGRIGRWPRRFYGSRRLRVGLPSRYRPGFGLLWKHPDYSARVGFGVKSGPFQAWEWFGMGWAWW